MTTRTTETTVTFNRPFVVGDEDHPYPPGEYLVATDEELIDQVSFPVWRRITTMIHVRREGATQVLTIDPAKLESLLAQDAKPASSG